FLGRPVTWDRFLGCTEMARCRCSRPLTRPHGVNDPKPGLVQHDVCALPTHGWRFKHHHTEVAGVALDMLELEQEVLVAHARDSLLSWQSRRVILRNARFNRAHG